MVPKLSPKARELKGKADQAYIGQKWKKALEVYLDVAREVPGDARLRQRIGDLYKRLNQPSEAVGEYKQAAAILAQDGFWAKAIALSKIILSIDPTDVTVQQQLAEMYAKQPSRVIALVDPDVTQPTLKVDPAVSISGVDPNEAAPFSPSEYGLLGATVSIAGSAPRAMDEPPQVLDLESADEITETPSYLGKPMPRIRPIPLLSEMGPAELGAVMERLAVKTFPLGALVCEEGDVGRSMYIISEGIVQVFTKDADGSRILLGQLSGGDFFGEYGLLTNGLRSASVQAVTDTELLEITWEDFDFISGKFPRIWAILDDYLRHRLIDGILKRSAVFRALTDGERKQLIGLLTKRNVKMDEVVMAEGTDGDEMYFVQSGLLAVVIAQGQEQVVVGEVGPGDYFGEVALLTGKPRTATVRARTEADLYCLHRREAAQVFRGNREILVRLKSKMEERAHETAAVFSSYKEARNTLELV